MEIKNRELHRVVSTAIIRKSGKYLIVQRSPDSKVFPLKWSVPGGGLEVDDYINTPKTTQEAWYFAVENSLKREVKEEVGLEVDNLRYLLSLIFIRPDNIPICTLSFYCDYKSGKVKLNEENINYKWVTAKEAKNYDLIDGILSEIEMVDKIISGKK